MAEPTMSPNSLDAGEPRTEVARESERQLHDRELPVSAAEADRPHHRSESRPAEPVPIDAGTPASAGAETTDEPLTEDQVKLALRRVKDPELNLNILDLGLVYAIRVDGNSVAIDMTLTSPGCPSGPEIMTDAERHLKAMPGVGTVSINLVWDPFWTPERIEPRVRAYLGF